MHSTLFQLWSTHFINKDVDDDDDSQLQGYVNKAIAETKGQNRPRASLEAALGVSPYRYSTQAGSDCA